MKFILFKIYLIYFKAIIEGTLFDLNEKLFTTILHTTLPTNIPNQ